MKDYTPTDFVHLIDSHFERLVGKIDRVDLEWGEWSAEMNVVIKGKIVDGTDSLLLGRVFTYWIVISQLLDLLYDTRGLKGILNGGEIKKKTQEAVAIKERILREDESS